MTPHSPATSGLLARLTRFSEASGASLLAAGDQAAQVLVAWVNYLQSAHTTGVADCLLEGVRATARESVACTTLGLVRPSIFAMRAQIDLMLSWLYFKDHAVEWDKVQISADGYKLKKEVLRYLEDNHQRFSQRRGMLSQFPSPGIEVRDPYAVLSAHVHSQSERTIPQTASLEDIVGTLEQANQCILLQSSVSEYLSDILMSLYAREWQGLPPLVQQVTRARLPAPRLKELCDHTTPPGLS